MDQIKLDDLPEVLDVVDIQKFLCISKNASYDLVKSGEFHVVKIGRTYKISKRAFANWFEGKQQQIS